MEQRADGGGSKVNPSRPPVTEPARGTMKHWIIALELTALLQLPAAATELKPDVINAATFTGKLPSEGSDQPSRGQGSGAA